MIYESYQFDLVILKIKLYQDKTFRKFDIQNDNNS